MMVNTNNLISITEANQNFSKVARLVDERGSAVILKNNVPRYSTSSWFRKPEAVRASGMTVCWNPHLTHRFKASVTRMPIHPSSKRRHGSAMAS